MTGCARVLPRIRRALASRPARARPRPGPVLSVAFTVAGVGVASWAAGATLRAVAHLSLHGGGACGPGAEASLVGVIRLADRAWPAAAAGVGCAVLGLGVAAVLGVPGAGRRFARAARAAALLPAAGVVGSVAVALAAPAVGWGTILLAPLPSGFAVHEPWTELALALGLAVGMRRRSRRGGPAWLAWALPALVWAAERLALFEPLCVPASSEALPWPMIRAFAFAGPAAAAAWTCLAAPRLRESGSRR